MPNVLTNLAGDIYTAADQVAREQVGLVPAVTLNSGSERVALNGTVRSHFTRAAAVTDNTPSMTIPEGTDQTVDNKTMTINKSRGVPIPYTGEDVQHLDNGSGFETVYGDQIAQAMRSLVNEMEADLYAEAIANASRAYGTPGTTPFGTANDYTDASNVLKILKDNGFNKRDNSLVLDSSAGANFIGKQSAVNAAGTDSMLRQGVLLDLAGMPLRESAAVDGVSSDGITANVTLTAEEAVGQTTLNVTTDAGGAVSLAAGDMITIAGDSEKYVVAAAATIGNSTTGDVIIAAPGLRSTGAAGAAVDGVAAATRNPCFSRFAVELAVRAPAKPKGGDAAVDEMLVLDPRSGLVFDISVYKGFQKSMVNVSAAWGVKAWKPEAIALLLG